MSVHPILLQEIEEFLAEFHIGEHRFGFLAVRNGRLVERLRSPNGKIWPHTEQRVRQFMTDRREAKKSGKKSPRQKAEARAA